jgi:HK97 gp10 family phage protein
MSDVKVKGLAELQKALDTLPAKIEANIMRAALRAGAAVIAAEAKQNVNSVSGDLAASIRFGAKLNRRAGGVEAYIRAGGKAKKNRKTVFYAHMVEQGTAAHIIKARPPNKMLAIGYAQVQHPGSRKRPFMRPALDRQSDAAVRAVGEYIRHRLATKHGIDVPAPIDPEAEE